MAGGGAQRGGAGGAGGPRRGGGGGRGEGAGGGRAGLPPANLNDGAATSSMSLLDKP